MLDCFNLCNVVMYDGINAYVSKFILPCKGQEVTKDGKERCEKYCNGNGEILKIDVLYPITFENMLALHEHGNDEEKCAVDRFGQMYFVV